MCVYKKAPTNLFRKPIANYTPRPHPTPHPWPPTPNSSVAVAVAHIEAASQADSRHMRTQIVPKTRRLDG